MLRAGNMVQQGPGRCNIKFFTVTLVQGAPGESTTAQQAPAHPREAQAVPNFLAARASVKNFGEISHFRVNWLVQYAPGRPTPAHVSSRRFIRLGRGPLT
jgi:hypothetical protein